MSADELSVSGGSFFVDTAELFQHAHALIELRLRITDLQDTLQRADDVGLRSVPSPPQSGVTAALFSARLAIDQVASDVEALIQALVQVAGEYESQENSIQNFFRFAGGLGAWTLGRAFVVAFPGLVAATPMVALAVAAAAGVAAFRYSSRGGGTVTRDIAQLTQNQWFARITRGVVASVDEAALGMLGVPIPNALLLGGSVGRAGSGVIKPSDSAAGLRSLMAAAGSGSSGALRETPVRIHSVPPAASQVAAPDGVEALVARVPHTGPDAPQIRIERYSGDTTARWIVYIAGTADGALVPGQEPFDMTSNVAAASGSDSGSLRAVTAALHAAGVSDGDPVLAVGHSQGGLVAARLAEDPQLNVVGFVSMGGPVAGVPTSPDVAGLSLEHRQDFIPTLTGYSEPSPSRITVERSLPSLSDTLARPETPALAAHGLERYQETAALVDRSDDPRLRGFRQALADFNAAGSGVVTSWRADRVSLDAPPAEK